LASAGGIAPSSGRASMMTSAVTTSRHDGMTRFPSVPRGNGTRLALRP
jgi:hypothetical protein